MKIHAGDSVLIIAGKDKGKQGVVLRVLPEKNRLIVEGINMRVRHIKKTPQQAGQRITYEASLAASNAMILDPKTKKPTRVGYRIDPKTGKKMRYAKVSGEVLPIKSTTSTTEKKTKKTTKTTNATPKESSTSSSSSTPSAPTRTPFWKRALGGAPKTEEGSSGGSADAAPSTPSAPVRRSRESS